MEELYKVYENAAKQGGKVSTIRKTVEKSKWYFSNLGQEEKEKSNSQTKMVESLHKGFLKKYNDMVAEAQNVEKEEENKRKALI